MNDSFKKMSALRYLMVQSWINQLSKGTKNDIDKVIKQMNNVLDNIREKEFDSVEELKEYIDEMYPKIKK